MTPRRRARWIVAALGALTGNGTSLAPQVTLNRAGYYAWRVRVPAVSA